MLPLWVDTETWSEVDLRAEGMARYVPHTELLLVTWALGDDSVQHWDITDPMQVERRQAFLQDVLRADVYRAANSAFDRLVLGEHGLIPPAPERWQCVQARARRAGWQRVSLAQLCTQLGLPEEDAKHARRGKQLVRLFTRPRKPTKAHPETRATRETHPEEWSEFIDYAMQDVVALRECWRRLPGPNDTVFEDRVWHLDQHINDRGWPIDIVCVRQACGIISEVEVELHERMEKLTDGAVPAITQLPRLKAWMQAQGGDVESLTVDIVEELARCATSPLVREAAQLRRDGSRATNAKWKALARCTSDDDRLRHALLYGAAARTLRWGGRAFQPQNLIRPPKGYDSRTIASVLSQGVSLRELRDMCTHSVLDILAFGIRGAVMARPGHMLVRGDKSQIEARVVNWLAGCDRMLRIFADPERDPYVQAAADIGSDNRLLGKVVTLACGYGMAGDTFRETAAGYGVELTSDEAKAVVGAWRESNSEVVSFWYQLEEACKRALWSWEPQQCRRLLVQVFEFADIHYLGIQLPSGRWLCLPRAHVDDSGWRTSIKYWGEKGWTYTHGGPLVGISTQSTARDLLAHDMLLAADAGFDIIGHVHDETVAEVPEDRLDELSPELLWRCMTTASSWATGLPLAAECVATKRFGKL